MDINRNTPKFCQFCGSGRLDCNLEESAFRCLNCGRDFYLNSKPAVCGVITRGREVLLVRGSDPLPPSWDFPGGFLNYGEAPCDGLRRELMEELQAEIEIGDLLDASVDTYGQYSDFSLNLFYEVFLKSKEIAPSAEITEYGWFDIDDLPPMRYNSTAEFLSRFANRIRKGI